jgi:methylthioribose-1-phosphate isomerase
MLLDQRVLPHRERFLRCTGPEQVARAIERMAVRGAPAIGVAAAMGLALGARRLARRRGTRDGAALRRRFDALCRRMMNTRPTAVNLRWAIERMQRTFETAAQGARDRRLSRGRAAAKVGDGSAAAAIARRLEQEALAIRDEDLRANRRMGALGAALVPRKATILTHCNAGALATSGYGTALGVVRAAREAGKRVEVLADETRPFLQGARLTAWELKKDRIPVRLITDSMAGHFLRRGRVDLVVVGADRIAANGDVANKIGTYGLAVLARENGVPFYVAAPLSTIDPRARSGADIPIEERSPAEVIRLAGRRIAPPGVPAEHPAFDVTPAPLVTAIITEAGVARPPYRRSLAALLRKGRALERTAARQPAREAERAAARRRARGSLRAARRASALRTASRRRR